MFAPDHHGGYLTFMLPAVRPYIDTRLVLHTGAEYAAFLSVLDDPARFDALDAKEGFRYVVLTTSNPDRYLPLAAHLVGIPLVPALHRWVRAAVRPRRARPGALPREPRDGRRDSRRARDALPAGNSRAQKPRR